MTQRQPLPTIRLSTLSATCYVRRELDIHGKMHLFGGSWGSTLALAYAIAHPETVQTLILRGVFLCRRADVDYFLQGNAADFALNELSTPAPGAYLDFPTAWQQFVAGIPVDDRGDVVKGLAKIFAAPRGQRQVGLLAAGEGGRLITTPPDQNRRSCWKAASPTILHLLRMTSNVEVCYELRTQTDGEGGSHAAKQLW